MITTKMKKLLLAAACIFAGVSAQAQYSGSAEQYPTTNYASSPITFSLSDVAGTLGTDAATLGAAIDEYVSADEPATVLFAANGTDWTAATEADSHGFWMAADGTPVGHGDNSVWYCSPSVDEAFTTLTFNVGQMPDVMQEGEQGKVTITLKFNGKEATFALTLNVIAKPVYEVPEPTVIEKDLQIVGQQEVVIEQFPRGGYDSDVVTVNIGDAFSLLGIDDKNLLVDAIEKVLYTTWYNSGDVAEGGGLKKDSLTNTPTGEGHGFWFRPVQSEEGEEYGEVSAAGWGDVDKFYMNSFTYTAEDDLLTCYLGQYPGSCKENEEWYANIYLIYGQKAYLIKYTLKLSEQEQGSGMSNYEKVGEESVVLKQEPLSDWASVQAKPDMESIAAALGCEVSAVGLVALDEKDNFGESTANNGGWWLTETGRVVAYANGAFYIEPATADDYSVLNVGHKPNTRQVGDELSASLYFTNSTKYFEYKITLQITEPEYVEYGFESVETRSFAVQALPNTNYTALDLITISAESIEAAIGTLEPTLYGLNIDSVAVVKGTYSNAYSCDPKPGFWLNADGRVSVWGDSNATIGISWVDNSIFRFFQYPNRTAVGDVFKTQLFLVNEETNKMMTVNITLSIVETLEEKEEVGSENIIIPFAEQEIETEVDLSKAAEALGIDLEELLSPNSYYLRGMAAGAYGEGVNCDNGLSFALNGDFDGYGDLYVYFTWEDGKVMMYSGSNNSVADDFHVKAQFCFDYDNKQYVFYATLASEEYIKNMGKAGDVNGDGAIDVADISKIISIMADGSDNPVADVNGDGAVDVADISFVISIMAGN